MTPLSVEVCTASCFINVIGYSKSLSDEIKFLLNLCKKLWTLRKDWLNTGHAQLNL